MRTATSVFVIVGLVASLAACSAQPGNAGGSDCAATPSGALSDAVDVSGELGAKPTVTIGFPTAAKVTERTVVIAGDGDTAVEGDTVNVQFTIFNGTTGEELTGTDYTDAGATFFPVDPEQFLVGVVKILECSQVGSRVVGVIPPADSFADAGSEQLGVAPGEDIVFVVDILSIEPPATPPLAKADGEDQPATDGFPTVVLDGDGRPTITIPNAAPPTELKLALLKKGGGATVQPGSDVVVHYVGINWNTKVIFDESWARGAPATFNTGGVIAGFTAALEGQTIGSQVIVIIPPDQGYGAAGSPPDIGGTDTLVFVVDILGVA